MTDDVTYDIAVSFSEDRRSYVEEVVDTCKQRGLTVLYDADNTSGWWLENARTDSVSDIHVRLFVPFISSPVDEFSVAMLRAVKQGDGHVLPVLVGDVSVDQDLLHPHILYLRSDKRTPDQLADRFAARTEGRETSALGEVLNRIVQTTRAVTIPSGFSKYEEQDHALRYLGQQFQAIAPQLRAKGLIGTVYHTTSRVAVRIERRGDTLYALDIQRGGMGGDETVNFVVGLHDPSSSCSNGWARPVFDKESGQTRLELHDLSLFGGSENRLYTPDELFSALWNKITGQLEGTSR